jgi:preprotein translocase subunit SecF
VFTHSLYGHASAIPAVLLALVLGTASTILLEEPLRRAWRQRQRAVQPEGAGLAPGPARTT